MPYQWTADRERLMLLLAVSSSNLKPSFETWTAVADLLGEGLTPSAVSQKYYKLRKDSVKLYNGTPVLTPPATPVKRKASFDEEEEVKHQTPTKRVKKPVRKAVKKEEALHEVELSSTYGMLSGYSSFHNAYDQLPSSLYGMKQIPMQAEEVQDFSFSSDINTV